MASSITLTWVSLPAVDTEITIVDSLTSINMTEVFKAVRTQQGETPANLLAYLSAFSYVGSFGLDYNNTSLYTISRNGTTVTITANNVNSQFSVTSNTTAGAVTTSISNEATSTPFEITGYTVTESLVSACDNVKVSVTTNEQADNIFTPINQTVTTNPFVFEMQRSDSLVTVTMEKDGVYEYFWLKAPKLLSSYFTINKVGTPSNAAISIDKGSVLSLSIDLGIQYSLDNSTWQTSNYFNNLPEGDYTLYIKDQLGCSTTKTFSIDAFTPNLLDYEPIAKISNLNSIRFKEDVVWDAAILKTPDNTLSFEEEVKMANKAFTQPFIKEIVPTQIETSYETVTAKLIDDIGNETVLPVVKMTSNMNITDVRDVSVDSATYNNVLYTAVKFSGGKTYDPVTLSEDSDYNLGINTPDWVNKDDYINLEGVGWYKVLDIIYSEDAYVVIINQIFNDFPFAAPKTLKATTVYNALDVENYEFDCDFTNKEGFYKVQVNLQDDNFGSKQFLSEWMDIKENHPNTVLIEAYNTENNEINYATGIKNKLRIRLAEDMKWKPNSEIEIYVTDTNTVNLDTKYRGFWDLSAFPLPTVMAEKLVLFLLQDRVFINTVNYISEGEPESNPIGSQYQIKANLVKSNYVYELYSGRGQITIETTGNPLSISPTGGFLLVD